FGTVSTWRLWPIRRRALFCESRYATKRLRSVAPMRFRVPDSIYPPAQGGGGPSWNAWCPPGGAGHGKFFFFLGGGGGGSEGEGWERERERRGGRGEEGERRGRGSGRIFPIQISARNLHNFRRATGPNAALKRVRRPSRCGSIDPFRDLRSALKKDPPPTLASVKPSLNT
ncbi:MAG: hypothetical protein BJ554DRAFT_3368, partial [Olpidium bornovanus]